jgi:hypothetical protein
MTGATGRTGLSRFVTARPAASASQADMTPADQAGARPAASASQAGTAPADQAGVGPADQAGVGPADQAGVGPADQAGTEIAAHAPSTRAVVPGPLAAVPGGPQSARRQAGAEATEKCEICATAIPAEHGHVADLEQSSLLCACRACYLLFTHSQAGRGRYQAIPDRYLADPDHQLSAADWDELQVPVGLAFFLRDSQDGGVTGFYPSPAGATECRLDLSAWERLTATHPLLGTALPDVEAVLIARGEGVVEYFLIPIDACYELAGRMRLQWRGFDGGAEARQSIDEFLAGLRARARTPSQVS